MGGCLGGNGTPPRTPEEPEPVSTIWERGLKDEAPTPSFVPTRSRATREQDVAPPGSAEFLGFDRLVTGFMANHEVPAATLAVLKDGLLRYQNGYGFLDEARMTATPPNGMFRVASVTKPVTAALTSLLVEEGRLQWTDAVYCGPRHTAKCWLSIPEHPSRAPADARLNDLQVRHLVDHQTGWTRAPCDVPFSGPEAVLGIADLLGVPSPPAAWRLAQWMVGEPMEFAPGTTPGEDLDGYCNMGYVLLGLVAEAATGTTLRALLDAYLFGPLEVRGDIEPGQTPKELRNPREPFYFCDYGRGPNVYDPSEEVCYADGGFDLRGALAMGGLVASASAIGTIYDVFANDGRPQDRNRVYANEGHSGLWPGTLTTVSRVGDGAADATGNAVAVIFFNKATGPDSVSPNTASYEFQIALTNLLAAYAGFEEARPAEGPGPQV